MHVKIYVSFTLHLLHLHPGSLVPGIRVCPEMLCVFRYKLIDVLTYIVKQLQPKITTEQKGLGKATHCLPYGLLMKSSR